MCPTYRDFKRDMQPLIEEYFDKYKINAFYHRQDQYYLLPYSKGKLYVVTAERPLRGPNWAYGLVNEITLIDIQRFREFIGRVRLQNATLPQVACVGTPEGIASPYYDFFIGNPVKGSRVIYGSTKENQENLNESYIDSLRASYDSVSLKAYLEGQWINMNGKAFYYSFDADKNKLTNHTPQTHIRHISIDFNVDPMCATVWDYDFNRIYAIDEVILEGGKGFDTKQLANALKARGYGPDVAILYPDPAGNSRSTKGAPDIHQLKAEGFTDIRHRAAAPRFRERQLNVNNLLEKRVVMVDPVKCPWLWKDLMAVTQDPVTLEKIKDNPKLTHSSDGMDYMLDILFPFSGRRSNVTEVRR